MAGGTDDEWIITLSEVVRDGNGDGIVDEADVTVVVDGNDKTTGVPQYTLGWRGCRRY